MISYGTMHGVCQESGKEAPPVMNVVEYERLFEENKFEKVKEMINNETEESRLQLVKSLSDENRIYLFRLMSKENALETFGNLEPYEQRELIGLLGSQNEEALQLLNEMEPDDRVRLFDELPASVVIRLLENLPSDVQQETHLLMGFPDHTIGRIMTTKFASFYQDETAGRTLDALQLHSDDYETINTIYIISRQRKLKGVLSLKELVIARPEDVLSKIMNREMIYVDTQTDQEEAAKLLHEKGFSALPVVDFEKRLVGILTRDDAYTVLQEEITEDVFLAAGIADDRSMENDKSIRLIRNSVVSIMKVRIPFLLITLLGGMLAGGVIGSFENAVQTVAAAAVFIPIIMAMGGNVATQSTTIFARGLALGHIDISRFARHLKKEIMVGLSIGSIIGFITFLVAGIWKWNPLLGAAVGGSIFCSVVFAALLGFLVPYILYKFKLDGAAGANPIITTINDITSLIIYFTFIRIILL